MKPIIWSGNRYRLETRRSWRYGLDFALDFELVWSVRKFRDGGKVKCLLPPVVAKHTFREYEHVWALQRHFADKGEFVHFAEICCDEYAEYYITSDPDDANIYKSGQTSFGAFDHELLKERARAYGSFE